MGGPGLDGARSVACSSPGVLPQKRQLPDNVFMMFSTRKTHSIALIDINV